MNLIEHEGKRLFREYGIPVPSGHMSDGTAPIQAVKFPAVVKAQVPIGGRGKAGGIRAVNDPAQLAAAVEEVLGMSIGGYRVRELLVEERVEGKREIYLSIAVDRSMRRPVVMASGMGGVDIESVPDELIRRHWIDPWVGLQPFVARSISFALSLAPPAAKQLQELLLNLWRLFQEMDAELVEMNPLVVTEDDTLVALDSKVVLDDDALFRHENMGGHAADMTPLEKSARDRGIAFVQLDGDIGVIANGAGLTMATLDFLSLHGGRGGVFLDLGGTDDPAKVKEALMLMAEARPKVVLINIFGGITKCDTVAAGLLQALEEGGLDIPVIARIKGVNEGEAIELLKGSKIAPAMTLDEAARSAVEMSRGGR